MLFAKFTDQNFAVLLVDKEKNLKLKKYSLDEIIVVQFRVPYPHLQHPLYPFLFLSQVWESF
jgi:hypothetical protein